MKLRTRPDRTHERPRRRPAALAALVGIAVASLSRNQVLRQAARSLPFLILDPARPHVLPLIPSPTRNHP